MAGKPNIDGLDPGARRDLLILLAKARDAGIPVTVTSGKRSREEQAALYANRAKNPFPVAPPGSSRHETGLAVDLSVPEAHRGRFNEMAAAHGYRWHGAKDRVHYEYGGKATKAPSLLPDAPAADPYARYLRAGGKTSIGAAREREADPYARYRQQPAAPPAADPYARYRSAPAAPAPTPSSAPDPYARYRQQPAAPQRPQAFNPLAVPESEVEAAATKARGAKPKQYGVLDHLGSLTNSYHVWLKQMAREGRKIPSVAQDPAGHFAALPGALQRAFTEARANFGPEAVEPTHFRDMAGAEKGKTNRALYNTLAVLDYASSWLTDPTNVVGGVASKGVSALGKATGVTRTVGNLAAGAKAQVQVQRATRAREAAETSYGAAVAGGAGSATRQKLGQELAQARAAEQAAQAATGQLFQSSRAAKLGVTATKAKPAAAAIKAELDVQAGLRQSKVKAVQNWLKGVGHVKGALLSNPGTIASNAAGSFVMAEHALAEAGVPLTAFLAQGRRAKQARDAYHKTKQAQGDLAELLQHAPGILDTPLTAGGAAPTRNPLLKVQGDADEIAKISLFSALKPTLGAEEAAKRVKAMLFDYNDIPALAKAADQYGLALFSSFNYAATKAIVTAAVRRPDLLARYPRLQKQLMNEFPGSEEAYEKLRPYQRGPLTLPVGEGRFITLGRYHPLNEMLRGPDDQEPRPPGVMDVVGRTAAGPVLRGLEKAQRAKGAPVEEQWKTAAREVIAAQFPAARDYLRWRAALEGATVGDWMTDEPQTVGQAALQSVGVGSVKGEVEAEKRDRLRPEVNARAKTAGDLARQLDEGLRRGTIQNQFAVEAGKLRNLDDAKRAFNDAVKYFQSMLLSPKNIDERGAFLSGGQERITDAALRYKALEVRVNELAREVARRRPAAGGSAPTR